MSSQCRPADSPLGTFATGTCDGKERPPCPPLCPFRRTNREIICITPASPSGSGPAAIRLMIDKAEVTSSETKYVYTEDPTIAGVEPNWTILK